MRGDTHLGEIWRLRMVVNFEPESAAVRRNWKTDSSLKEAQCVVIVYIMCKIYSYQYRSNLLYCRKIKIITFILLIIITRLSH